MISGPLTRMKLAPVSFATAFAINVFPEPGGPCKRTPAGGSIPNLMKISGCFNGNSTISLIFLTSSFNPPMSS